MFNTSLAQKLARSPLQADFDRVVRETIAFQAKYGNHMTIPDAEYQVRTLGEKFGKVPPGAKPGPYWPPKRRK